MFIRHRPGDRGGERRGGARAGRRDGGGTPGERPGACGALRGDRDLREQRQQRP